MTSSSADNDPGPFATSAGGGSARPFVFELRKAAVSASTLPHSVLVEGIDWGVRAGEFWVIGGLPGSGKSQLLETAAGLKPPARGTHWLFDRELAAVSAAERWRVQRRVGFVFADGGRLFGQLSIGENVGLPLCYHQDCPPEAVWERIEALLRDTGIEALANVLPRQTSRSCRQRAALARSLVLEPEVLFLDNPLAGLDPGQTRWWLDFLTQLHAGHGRQGDAPLTLVVATDDLRPWLGIARQFALLKDKSWLPLGGRAEIAASQEPLLRELLADSTPTG